MHTAIYTVLSYYSNDHGMYVLYTMYSTVNAIRLSILYLSDIYIDLYSSTVPRSIPINVNLYARYFCAKADHHSVILMCCFCYFCDYYANKVAINEMYLVDSWTNMHNLNNNKISVNN